MKVVRSRRKKRRAPAHVDDLLLNGIAFSKSSMNHVRATNEAGELVWDLQVYDVVYDGHMERDKQDIHISGIMADEEAGWIVVEHERNGRFRVNIATQEVVTVRPGRT